MSYYYKAEEVRKLAENQWLFILASLAPEITEAIQKLGRHITCPVHGGKKDFRLFKDAHQTGGGICNSQGCGAHHDGFELLMWLKNCDFQAALMMVGDYVRAEKHFKRSAQSDKSDVIKPAIKSAAGTIDSATAINGSVEPQSKPRFSAKGKLVGVGTDHYQNDPKNEKSYFAKLENKSGFVKTVWGIDIERAITESDVEVGDVITLNNLGRKAVTITREIRNDQGDTVREEQISTHRNTWSVINHSSKPVKVDAVPDEVRHAEKEATTEEAEQQCEPAETSKTTDAECLRDTAPEWLIKAQEKAEDIAKRRKQSGERAQASHQKLWDECVGLDCNLARPAHLYLDSRKILTRFDQVSEGDSLRFHPNVPYYDEDGKITGNYPAIICAIRDVHGEIVTLHRTYLTHDGKKAPVEDARKMMTVPDGFELNGCAIPMGNPKSGVIGIAEGLETAWSGFKATGIPTWSTVNAQLMKTFEVPEGVHTVIVWADLDKSKTGEIAAEVLKLRLEAEGYNVIVLLPQAVIPQKAKGVDWNDILCKQGIIGFPPARMLKSLLTNLN